jgi:hypothetical protein
MIAGPYRSGATSLEDRSRNLRALNQAAYEIFQKGHIPIIGVNLALPIIESAGELAYDDIMMPISLAAAEKCDGILRVGGPSEGADLEVERVRSRGGRVYAHLSDITSVT